MAKKYVYLAGPVSGTSYSECTDWRNYVVRKISEQIRVLSPMRGKSMLAHSNAVQDQYKDHPLLSQKGIVCRDSNDVKRADAILVNFSGAKKVSIGTVMEIAWAHLLGKPIIVVMEKDNIHQHSFVREVAGFITENLDDGISLVESVILP